jgi:DNA mismatch repair protein MutS
MSAANPPAKPETADAKVTPMMAQFFEIKANYQDALLFYRMGDFYELFFDDAESAAAALDITLTHRGKHLGQNIPMCGVPYHAAEAYLERLIRKGFRVAICEQAEDPAEAKKRGSKSVVRREVVRLVTPGTLSEDSLLDARAHNYIAAIAAAGEALAVAWLDMSTGAFGVMPTQEPALGSLIARLAPREILRPAHIETGLIEAALAHSDAVVAEVADLTSPSAHRLLCDFYGVKTADGFGDLGRPETIACGLLLAYIQETQIDHLPRLAPPRVEETGAFMGIDAATRANLELTRTLSGDPKGSLLATLDMTVTASGGRLLGATSRGAFGRAGGDQPTLGVGCLLCCAPGLAGGYPQWLESGARYGPRAFAAGHATRGAARFAGYRHGVAGGPAAKCSIAQGREFTGRVGRLCRTAGQS